MIRSTAFFSGHAALLVVALLSLGGLAYGQPSIFVAPPNVEFGSVAVGSLYLPGSKTEAVRVYNTGSTTLHVSGITNAETEFGVDLGTFDVEPSTFHEVQVTFTPSGVGIFSDTLSIASDDALSPTSVPLNGEGITSPPELSGDKTVGPGGDYTTLGEALDAISAGVIVGPLNLILTEASYSENELLIQQTLSTVPPSPLTIKPAPSGVTPGVPMSVMNHITIDITRDNPGEGGAIHLIEAPNVHFEHVTFNLLPGDAWDAAVLTEGECPVVSFTDCDLGNASMGFQLEATGSLTLAACNISDVGFGIYVPGQTTLSVTGCQISTTDAGIVSDGNETLDNLIQGNTFTGNGTTYASIMGVFIGTSLTIDDNDISGNDGTGISIDGYAGFVPAMTPATAPPARRNVKEAVAAFRAKATERVRNSKTSISSTKKSSARDLQSMKDRPRRGGAAMPGPLLSIKNNVVSIPGSDGGVILWEVIDASVEILDNSLTATDAMQWGIYCGSIDNSQSVDIERNTVRGADYGIQLESTYIPEGGSFIVKSNDIESFTEGMFLGEVFEPLIVDIRDNIVTAVEPGMAPATVPAGRKSSSAAASPTGDVGLWLVVFSTPQVGSALTIDGNTIEGFVNGIQANVEVGCPVSISDNQIADAAIGIYMENVIAMSLAIDGNAIDFEDMGIYGEFFALYDPDVPGGMSLSSNTLDDNSFGAQAAVLWGYAQGYSLAVNSDTVIGQVSTGIFFDTFEGIEIFPSSSGPRQAIRGPLNTTGSGGAPIVLRERLSKRSAESIHRHPEKIAGLREKWNNLKNGTREAHPPRTVTAHTPATVSIADNDVDYLNGDGGLFVGEILNSDVSITDNTITAGDFSPYGIYIAGIENSVHTSIERNTIQNVEMGITVESTFIPPEEMGSFTLSSNTIGCYQFGLFLGEIVEPLTVDISDNDVSVIAPAAAASTAGKVRSRTPGEALPSGDEGMLLFSFTSEPGHTILIHNNHLTDYNIGAEIYLEGFEHFTLSNNVLDLNDLGLHFESYGNEVGTGSIYGNSISENTGSGAEVYLNDYATPVQIQFNTIVNNAGGEGIRIASDLSATIFENNNILGSGGFDVFNDGDQDIEARHNWWGVTTTADMDAGPYPRNIDKIWDVQDDAGLGMVIYGEWRHEAIGAVTASISGKKFNDIDGDCVQDPGEEGLSGWVIHLMPPDFYATTDANGNYAFDFLAGGSYTVSEVPKLYWEQTCPTTPGTHEVVLAAGEQVMGMNFGNRIVPGIKDLRIDVAGGIARPGFDKQYGIRYENKGTEAVVGTVTFQHPLKTSYLPLTSNPPHTSYDLPSRTITWDVGSVEPGDVKYITLGVKIDDPPSVNIGDLLTSSGHIAPTAGDENPADNDDQETQQVRGSFDPNDKTVIPAGLGIQADDQLDYQVRFQNTGTDTAFTVVVRDTLDPELDISTVAVGAASHSYALSISGRELKFTFSNIDLPDSNVDEPGSHGFVNYSIELLPGSAIGTAIDNRADIYFDFNLPVATNTTHNVVGVEQPVSVLMGWNIVGNPIQASNDSADVLYPSSITDAYLFDAVLSTYQTTQVLTPGRGAWLKFGAPENFIYFGAPVESLAISLAAGWNLVGSITTPVDVSNAADVSAMTAPSGIILTDFFGFEAGYAPAPTIEPGKGYWVKVNQAGVLNLRSAGITPKTDRRGIPAGALQTLNAIVIRDAGGNTQRLYVGRQPDESFNVERYVLPPKPPAGVFDARFASQRYVEVRPAGGSDPANYTIELSAVSYPLTVTAELADGGAEGLVLIANDGSRIALLDGKPVQISDASVTALNLELSSGKQIPTEFLLHQNFPNPFNPATRIRFDLPVDSKVTLKVFDVLGREVATLLEGRPFEAGWGEVEFNASELPTGLYIYRIVAEAGDRSFTDLRKMMLMK